MMGLVPFLLPPEDRPSLERLVCLAEKESNKNEPQVVSACSPTFLVVALTLSSVPRYKSRKVEAFASWPLWPESIRMEVLYITRRPFCSFGYDRVLRDQVGDLPELRGFCDKVGFDNSRDGFRVVDAPSVPYRPNRPTRAECVLNSALLEGQVTDARSCRTPVSLACALSVWVSYTLPLCTLSAAFKKRPVTLLRRQISPDCQSPTDASSLQLCSSESVRLGQTVRVGGPTHATCSLSGSCY